MEDVLLAFVLTFSLVGIPTIGTIAVDVKAIRRYV